MTDNTQNTMAPKTQTVAAIGPMALTGISSSVIGDQFGNALAKIVAWVMAIQCQCVPPPAILDAVQTITVGLVVGFAYLIHMAIIKSKTSNLKETT